VTNCHLTPSQIDRLLRNGFDVTHIRDVTETHSLCRISAYADDWLTRNPVEVWMDYGRKPAANSALERKQ
jgi:hypothetical protein